MNIVTQLPMNHHQENDEKKVRRFGWKKTSINPINQRGVDLKRLRLQYSYDITLLGSNLFQSCQLSHPTGAEGKELTQQSRPAQRTNQETN